jgi:hypothetical protein
MKWFIVWICACNADPMLVYSGEDEAHVRQVQRDLHAAAGGAYIIARMHDKFEVQPRIIWNERTNRMERRTRRDTRR